MVPHLVTALSGPLLALEEKLLGANALIERWFRFEWQEHTPPFYCAVDMCNAGYKLASTNCDLFPNSFIHLSDDMLPLAVQAAVSAIEKYCPDAKGLLFIPDHRLSDDSAPNDAYWANVLRVSAILKQTGLDVRYGTIDPDCLQAKTVHLKDGRSLLLEPLSRKGKRVGIGAFDPCAVLLNHPLAGGLPNVLNQLYEQVLLPPLHAASSQRRLSEHWLALDEVAKRFSKAIGIDPWLISPYSAVMHAKGGSDRQGVSAIAVEDLIAKVDSVLKKIKAKYKEHGIKTRPFVTLRADIEAYQTRPLRIDHSGDIHTLLNDDAIPNNGCSLIIQEGLTSIESLDGHEAFPSVLMVDRFVVGGFYQQSIANAAAQAAVIKPLPFSKPCNMPDCGDGSTSAPNRFYAYGVIARLSLLAAALELERTDPDQSQYG